MFVHMLFICLGWSIGGDGGGVMEIGGMVEGMMGKRQTKRKTRDS